MIQDFQPQKIMIVAGNLVFAPLDKVLLVQEGKPEFRGKWSFPMGRREPGESIIRCAEREGEEETGYKVKVSHLIGMAQRRLFEIDIFGFFFYSEIVGGELRVPKDEDILDVKWFSFYEIEEMNARKLLIDPYILSVVNDFSAGVKIPLDRLRTDHLP